MSTLFALPFAVSAAFAIMALLGSEPWPMVIALPLVIGSCWVLA